VTAARDITTAAREHRLSVALDEEIAELRRDVAGWAYLRHQRGWGDFFRDFEERDVHVLRALLRLRRRAGEEPEQADPLTAAKARAEAVVIPNLGIITYPRSGSAAWAAQEGRLR
jgi:hypothetical protein